MRNIKRILVSESELQSMADEIRQTKSTKDGHIYPDNEQSNAGHIIQSNNIAYTDKNGNITMYYAK